VRFDFLMMTGFGLVTPTPLNLTTYTGSIYVFEAKNRTSRWKLLRTIRPPTSLFIGHSVALHGERVAFGSTEGTAIRPATGVFLSEAVSNRSIRFRYIASPAGRTGFGRSLHFDNSSLLIGTDVDVGIYPFPALKQAEQWLEGAKGVSATQQRVAATVRDEVIVYALRRNISLTHCRVMCKYATVTANVTITCEIRTFDSLGAPNGSPIDTSTLGAVAYGTRAQPSRVTRLLFLDTGRYQFEVTPTSPGSLRLFVLYKGRQGNVPCSVTVTNAIAPWISNFTCPRGVVAGSAFTCTIHVFPTGTGEVNAATHFSVLVQNLNNDSAVVVPVEDVQVAYVRRGVYSFRVPTNQHGVHTVLVKYMRRALSFPNPAFIDVLPEPFDVRNSEVSCPPFVRPNRTVRCALTFRGPKGTLTGNGELRRNVTRSNLHSLVWWPQARVEAVHWVWVGTAEVFLNFRMDGSCKLITKMKNGGPVLAGLTVPRPVCTGNVPQLSELVTLLPASASSENFIHGTTVENQFNKMCEKYKL